MKNFLRAVHFFCLGLVAHSMASATEIVPKNMDLLCVTEFPTTSFIGETVEGRLKVQLINSNGVNYMPIHSGLLTIADVELLKQRAEVLKNVGDLAEFSFDLKNCTVYEDQTFRCSNGSEFSGVNGDKISVQSLNSSKQTTHYMGMSFPKTQIQLYVMINNEMLQIAMDYHSNHECKMEFSK